MSDLRVLTAKLARFHGLSDDDGAALKQLPLQKTAIALGQDLIQAGERTGRCAVILEGMAFSYKIIGKGERQIVGLHLAGDMPDIESMHLGSLEVGIAAASWCCVGYLPHAALNDLCSRRLGVTEVLWRETLLEAAIRREWLSNVGRRDALARLSHLLCETVVRHRMAELTSDYSCSFPLTQTALADALGLSIVHINRVLQKLRGKHLIETKDRRLTVLDWERLCEIAEFDPAYLYLYLERRPPNIDEALLPTSPSSAGSRPAAKPALRRSASRAG